MFDKLYNLLYEKLLGMNLAPDDDYPVTYFNETALCWWSHNDKEFYVRIVLNKNGDEDYGYMGRDSTLYLWLMRPNPIEECIAELEKAIFLLN